MQNRGIGTEVEGGKDADEEKNETKMNYCHIQVRKICWKFLQVKHQKVIKIK